MYKLDEQFGDIYDADVRTKRSYAKKQSQEMKVSEIIGVNEQFKTLTLIINAVFIFVLTTEFIIFIYDILT